MSPLWPGNREEFCLMFIWEISSQLRRIKNVQRPTQILAVNQLACHLGFPAKLLRIQADLNFARRHVEHVWNWTTWDHAQLNMFRLGNRDGVFIWERFPARTSQASHMNTSKNSRRNEWRGEISETELAPFRPCSYEEALKYTLKYSSRYYIYLKIITFRIFLMNFWDSYCSSKELFTFAEHSKRGVPYDIFSFKTSLKGILVRNSNWCTYTRENDIY